MLSRVVMAMVLHWPDVSAAALAWISSPLADTTLEHVAIKGHN
jgi:hypothetical protein